MNRASATDDPTTEQMPRDEAVRTDPSEGGTTMGELDPRVKEPFGRRAGSDAELVERRRDPLLCPDGGRARRRRGGGGGPGVADVATRAAPSEERRTALPNAGRPTLGPPVDGRDHALGSADLPVTLVEYGDYECPYTRRARPVVRRLMRELGGDLRFVFRHFPLDHLHPHARRAAEAAEAAASQGALWPMHEKLFENQWALEDESLRRCAAEPGLDVERFDGEMAGHRHAQRVDEDLLGGLRSGVEGTPTFFVDGVRQEGDDVGSGRRPGEGLGGRAGRRPGGVGGARDRPDEAGLRPRGGLGG